MLAPATAFYAIALVALKLLLVGRIIALRQRLGVGIGDGGYRELQTAIRVHGNYLEYLPLVLVLMFIAEMNGVNYAMLHVAGLVFVVSRFGHAYGLSEGQEPGTGRGRPAWWAPGCHCCSCVGCWSTTGSPSVTDRNATVHRERLCKGTYRFPVISSTIPARSGAS